MVDRSKLHTALREFVHVLTGRYDIGDVLYELTEEELDTAHLLAEMAAGYISNLVVLEDAERLAKQLHHALDTRVVIEQAKGVIAELTGSKRSSARWLAGRAGAGSPGEAVVATGPTVWRSSVPV